MLTICASQTALLQKGENVSVLQQVSFPTYNVISSLALCSKMSNHISKYWSRLAPLPCEAQCRLVPLVAFQKLPLHSCIRSMYSCVLSRALPYANGMMALPSTSSSVTPFPMAYPCCSGLDSVHNKVSYIIGLVQISTSTNVHTTPAMTIT